MLRTEIKEVLKHKLKITVKNLRYLYNGIRHEAISGMKRWVRNKSQSDSSEEKKYERVRAVKVEVEDDYRMEESCFESKKKDYAPRNIPSDIERILEIFFDDF